MTASSSLVVGTVRHRRYRPTRRAFTLRTYHALIDLAELDDLDAGVGGFGVNRPAVFGFRDTDHLGAADAPVRDKLAAWLGDRGLTLPDGPIRVLTSLRVLGYVFDPVTWWFCHHADGRLAFVVAEVHNTFGDAHAYLLDDLDQPRDGRATARAQKVFHVSPFLPIDGLEYRFAFALGQSQVTAHVAVHDADGVVFDATQTGRITPFTTQRLWWVNATHPLLTWRVITRIHLEALRLLRRRTPFHRRPQPPDSGFRDVAADDDRITV